MTDEITPVRHIRHDKALRFTVVAYAYEHYVEYFIYDIVGFEDDNADKPLWQRAGSHTSPDCVETLDQAEVYLSGSIKWDGCSNWKFDEQDRCMLHACDREGLLRYGLVMALCWDWMDEICPRWCP